MNWSFWTISQVGHSQFHQHFKSAFTKSRLDLFPLMFFHCVSDVLQWYIDSLLTEARSPRGSPMPPSPVTSNSLPIILTMPVGNIDCWVCSDLKLLKLSSSFFFFFFFGFRDRVSLCSPGCPGTHSVDQAGLELRNPPASASRVLGLKACTTMPGWSYFLCEL
jgi:hypothetical protein